MKDRPFDQFGFLSKSWREVIQAMQEINFGRIENLRFACGDPLLDQNVRVITEYKVGGVNGPREDAMSDVYTPKKQVLELIDAVERLGNGVILRLVVKHGLPFTFEVEGQ